MMPVGLRPFDAPLTQLLKMPAVLRRSFANFAGEAADARPHVGVRPFSFTDPLSPPMSAPGSRHGTPPWHGSGGPVPSDR